MGKRNISISDEAYSRLPSLKRPTQSFTDVINRLAGKRSLLELAGILTGREAEELRRSVGEVRAGSRKRLDRSVRRMRQH